MYAIAWLVLAAALVLIELHTGTFYFLLLAVASVIAIFVALSGLPLLVQCFTFVFAIALLYMFLLPLLRKLVPSTSKTLLRQSTEYLVGQEAFVIQTITPEEAGLVKVHGEIWSAVSNEKLDEGTKVIVREVHVTKLSVTKE
ncbi:membrane protein implicated in regulation of membrane protease activity [Paenibacillus taihuensis]|uniref:Membrane protein implicated in regulation of membrane protease activity n=1 Tax=Paenibacillus taihuensis TaxID=1156355 RepID=A0A3D9S0L1_9BACL|nr:NfeD family protein [Paenibacillus taihuensis]REE85313.1 membrane protein implicated in regulation of membrane protease activity [Paenibacillus taihuensis]